MFKRYGTQAPKIETTRLYRAQQVNPTFNPKTAANGEAQAAYAGQWFTPNVEKIDWYALNASNKGTPVEIQYVDIPTKDLKKYAAEGIVPKNFDLEIGEDFIIPETIKRTTIPLNNTTKLNILEHTASNAAKSAPEFTSPLMERIKKYVPEARERYGLVGRTDITDDEIAGSLYKKAMALSKPGNAAVNEFGEPLLLFRGDTRRYRSFEPKLTPDQLAKGSGSMDNAFGNLFLGDLGKGEEGVERYINYVIEQPSGYKMIRPSATGDKAHFGNLKFKQDFDDNATIFPESALSYDLQPPSKRTGGISIRTRKLLPDFVDSGVNDINGFIINTPGVRNATMEISPEMGGRFVVIDGKPRFKNGNGVDRDIAAKRMQQILDEAKMRKEGLLLSKKNSPLRESEHSKYDYYALPNFNINGAKSILPYDLNRPSTFIDKGFVYRKNGGKI